MVKQLRAQRSPALRLQDLLAVRRDGNVSTMDCVPILLQVYMVDTAALTRAGTHRVVPQICAHMVRSGNAI